MWYLNIEDTVLSCDTTDEVVYYLMGYGDPHYKAPVLLGDANIAVSWLNVHLYRLCVLISRSLSE